MVNKKAAQAGTRTASNKSNECQNSTPQKVLISDLYKVGGGYSVRFTFSPKAPHRQNNRPLPMRVAPLICQPIETCAVKSQLKSTSLQRISFLRMLQNAWAALLCFSLGGEE